MIQKKNRFLIVNFHERLSPIDSVIISRRKTNKIFKDLLTDHPSMKKWIPVKKLNTKAVWPEMATLAWGDNKVNVSGSFIASNVKTSTTVLHSITSPNEILDILKKGRAENFPFTHVGFSIMMTSYSKFLQSTKIVRDFDESIIIIAGNIGAFVPGTEKYVDYIVRGDGIPFLRKLFNEREDEPYKLELYPTTLDYILFGLKFKVNIVNIVTKLGCPMKCDFCVTNQLFAGKFTPSYFTPIQVYNKLVEYKEKTKSNFKTLFCESSAIISKKWWYDLFKLFEKEKDDYPILIAARLNSISSLDLDKISKSSMRIEGALIGIESLTRRYTKNPDFKKMKEILHRLHDHGIKVIATYIIGFDFHNHKNVWEEVDKLLELELDGCDVLNLKPLPLTPLWNKLKNENRLLNVPYDFYYIDGFQSFKHPHFKSGFEDMYPLLRDIQTYILKEQGNPTRNIDKIENLIKHRPYSENLFSDELNEEKILSKLMYKSWKRRLEPSDKLKSMYLNKLDKLEDINIPLKLKMLANSKVLRNLMELYYKSH